MSGNLKPHELCLIPDQHTDAEIAKLVSSMEVQGYDPTQPIVIYEGKILDGWGRYKAAKLANVTAAYSEFVGSPTSEKSLHEQAVDFCYFRALARRHMPLGRLAAIAIAYNEHRAKNGETPYTHEELAEMAGTSSSYVGQASSVAKREGSTGAGSRIAAIIAGETSLPAAYRELAASVPVPINTDESLADVWATRERWKLVILHLQELGEKEIDPLRSRRGSESIVESMASKRKENGVVKLGKSFVEYSIEQIKANMPDRPCENCNGEGEGCGVCRGRGWWTVAEAKARRR